MFLLMNLPADTSEVHSFIGLVQYSATFMPDVSSIANCPQAQINSNPSPGESGFKVHELRGWCCSYKFMTLKLCTGLGRQLLLMHHLSFQMHMARKINAPACMASFSFLVQGQW